MSDIPCFWAVATGRAALKLRRYIGELEGGKCSSAYGYHNASVTIGELAVEIHNRSWRTVGDEPIPPADNDPRWPTVCECGYVFPRGATRQQRYDVLYAGSPDGVERPLMELPVGAVWHAWWYEPEGGVDDGMFHLGPDGKCISVRTPGGEWCIDQRSAQGTHWQRPALPALAPGALLPMLTVTPSIAQPRYHGWLRAGKLVQC